MSGSGDKGSMVKAIAQDSMVQHRTDRTDRTDIIPNLPKPFVLRDCRNADWFWQPRNVTQALFRFEHAQNLHDAEKPTHTLSAVEPDFEAQGVYIDLAHKILERYAVEKSFYVGAGQSPFGIIAYLQERFGEETACNLPLSSDVPLVLDSDESFLLHLEKFLPSHEVLAGRKIVLIDYIYVGTGLDRASHFVHEHYRRKGHPVDIATVALGENLGTYFFSHEIALSPKDREVLESKGRRHYSQYGRFNPAPPSGHQSANLAPRLHYRHLRNLIRSHPGFSLPVGMRTRT